MECSVEGCTNIANVPGTARGLCRAHYHRWQRYGTEYEPSRRVNSWAGEICAEKDCNATVYANGLCINHHAVMRRRNNPEASRRRQIAFKGRLQAKQEILMGRPRPFLCEICGEGGYGRTPSIVFDHCHKTGKPRGWLCDRCNKTLGLVKDSASLLSKMLKYLEEHHGPSDNGTSQRVANKRIRRERQIISNRHGKSGQECLI
jgi:hypothetical protein